MDPNGTIFRDWVLSQQVCGRYPTAVDDSHIRIALDTAIAEVNIYPPFDEGFEIAEYRVTRIIDGESIFFLHVLLDDLDRAKELFDEMTESLEEEEEHQAVHVLLCCTSALTTTLFASKMGEVAIALSLNYDFTAMPIVQALQPGGDWAAVLLAPQASHMRRQIMEAHPDAVVFEIPGKIFGSFDAAAAVQLVMHALHDVQETNEPTGNLRASRDLANDRRILIITLFTLRDQARLGYRLFDHGKKVYDSPDIETIKQYCREQVETLWEETLRFENPQSYYVDLSQKLYELKQEMIREHRDRNESEL